MNDFSAARNHSQAFFYFPHILKITEEILLIYKQKANRTKAVRFVIRSNTMLAATRGENFVDSGIKILIAVVIGALLLGGLYALFGDTILPTLTNKVKEMFNFKG